MPPKYNPGDIMKGTDNNDINEALEDIQRAIDFLDGKACAIAIANIGDKRLVNPYYYLSHGDIVSSPPHTIDLKKTGLILFTRKFSKPTLVLALLNLLVGSEIKLTFGRLTKIPEF